MNFFSQSLLEFKTKSKQEKTIFLVDKIAIVLTISFFCCFSFFGGETLKVLFIILGLVSSVFRVVGIRKIRIRKTMLLSLDLLSLIILGTVFGIIGLAAGTFSLGSDGEGLTAILCVAYLLIVILVDLIQQNPVESN